MNALVKSVSFNNLRIPYEPALEDLGIDNIGWKVLIDTTFPSAKSFDAIVMALTYCRKRNLDPLKRVVHIVPMWSTARRALVETVWPGIAELRTTAFRTGQYAGCDEAQFGPVISDTFSGTHKPYDRNKPEESRTEEVDFPEWCQITMYRILHGERCKFVGPKVYWEEAYARWKDTDVPNEMWCKRPFGQIEKCAEAAALRRAFPEELGNELTAEEMEGRVAPEGLGYDIPTNVREADTRRPPAPQRQIEAQATPTVDTGRKLEEAELVHVGEEHGGTIDRDAPRDTRRPPPPRKVDPNPQSAPQKPPPEPNFDTDPFDEGEIIARFERLAEAAHDEAGLALAWSDYVAPWYPRMSPEAKKRVSTIYDDLKG